MIELEKFTGSHPGRRPTVTVTVTVTGSGPGLGYYLSLFHFNFRPAIDSD